MSRPESPFSVVICAYNGIEYTKLLVGSIRRHSVYEHEIVVYSDGSTDGTLAWLRDQADVRWQHDRTNRGICTAMNRGAKMATREYLFFPNTDHVLAPGWDETLLDRLTPRRVVSFQCIEPGIVPVAPIFHARNCGTRWDEFDEARFLDAARELARDRAVPGVNYPFALSRQLWDEVGGVDELFNPGPANDPDLFYRLHFAGAEMVRAEDALVYHFSGKSSRLAGEAKVERDEWHRVTDRNEARFAEKWGERYRYANGGLPDPAPEARRRWTEMKRDAPRVEVKSRLHVAIDARSVAPGMQGVGVYTASLVRALSRLPEVPRIDCWVGNADAFRELAGSGVTCHRERPRGDAQVFHGPAFALPDAPGIPSVVTIHDVIFRLHPEWYPGEFVRHMQATVEESVSRADGIIAVSESTKRDLLEIFPAAARKVTRVYEGRPEDARPVGAPAKDAIREKYAGGAGFILSIGVQQRRKNAAGLVRAFAALKREGKSPHRLVLVGGRECEDPELPGLVESLGLAADVTLTPHLPREEVAALLSACDLFVYPSFYEGFGLPLLEAMACGAPVVCSGAGALPEVAGDAAAFCSPDDAASIARAMEEVLAVPERRSQLVLLGQERVKRFTWEEAARQTLAVYEKAIADRAAVAQVSARVPATPEPHAPRGRARLRVAVDARLLGQDRLGTGRYTTEILRALLARASEAEFVLIGPESIDAAILPQNDAVMQTVGAPAGTLLDAAWEQFSLPAHLLGCDVYFAPTGILPVARPCQGVAVVHDLGFEDHPEYYEPDLQAHLARWVRNSCLSADRVIAVSEFTAGRVCERYGLSRERLSVVHHGRPEEWLKGLPACMHRGLRDADPSVLCVSSLEPNKNVEMLVDAFGAISGEWPGRLVLAGRRGRALGAVEGAVAKHGLGSRVRLAIDPTDAELAALYREASLFVYPSVYEGFGLPLLEAMCCGLPVVAYRVAACPEVLADAGILAEDVSASSLAVAMKRILLDPSLAEDLSRRSLARAAAFSWSKAAAETWDAIRSCAEAR